MKDMEDGSIGSIVCDPPYDLTSVSRGGSSRTFVDNPYGRTRIGTDRGGFMGKTWDGTGIAFSPALWSEIHRVLAPGGMVKAFGGTRTFHRMTRAMREAGFVDLRLEAWAYGSGFPKSLNIGKAMDKAAGAEREVVETRVLAGKAAQDWRDKGGHTFSGGGTSAAGLTKVVPITAPATDAARTWEGWGTALKPAWEPVVVGVKP